MLLKILALVTCFVLIQSELSSDISDAIIAKCKAAVPKITQDEIKEITTNAYFETVNRDAKCFGLCLAVELNITDENGWLIEATFAEEKLPTYFDVELVKMYLPNCRGKTQIDSCETAYVQWRCIVMYSMTN